MNVFTQYQSLIGTLTLQANDHGLLGLWCEIQTTQPEQLGERNHYHPVLQQAIAELEEYFAGHRRQFSVPVVAVGTPFQRQVWQALTTIPCGETWSYQGLALAIDNPNAVRAVGVANSKNPVSIIVPCHRVIGKNGALTGYAGGVQTKSWLLEHEAKMGF